MGLADHHVLTTANLSALRELEPDYVVIHELGRGATSVVYLASRYADGERVAVKVLPVGPTADGETLQRFANEARVISGLHHPSIVRHHEVRRWHGTGLALVMQYVSGDTLRHALELEPQPPYE